METAWGPTSANATQDSRGRPAIKVSRAEPFLQPLSTSEVIACHARPQTCQRPSFPAARIALIPLESEHKI